MLSELEEKKKILEELKKKQTEVKELESTQAQIDQINREISQAEYRKNHPIVVSFSNKYMNAMRKVGNGFSNLFKQKLAYGYFPKENQGQTVKEVKKDTSIQDALNDLE